MTVHVRIPDEIYLKWLDFNTARGTASSGRYAGIGKVNSDIFIDAIKKEMENNEK